MYVTEGDIVRIIDVRHSVQKPFSINYEIIH